MLAGVSQQEHIILGIDPGTRFMGYGILRARGTEFSYIDMGVLNLSREADVLVRLEKIHEEVTRIIGQYHPDCISIEAPFFGKNPQSLIKLGRAQGVAIAAGMSQGVKVYEYAPLKIKQAITGNGAASKEQVCAMVFRLLNLRDVDIPKHLDATDAMAAAVCHALKARYEGLETGAAGSKTRTSALPAAAGKRSSGSRKKTQWAEFVAKNQDRIL